MPWIPDTCPFTGDDIKVWVPEDDLLAGNAYPWRRPRSSYHPGKEEDKKGKGNEERKDN